MDTESVVKTKTPTIIVEAPTGVTPIQKVVEPESKETSYEKTTT